jgi:hypothetical protein
MSGGSMSFLIVRHDDGCPMITPTPAECTCGSPRAEMVTRNKFVATVTRDRKARRAAARAAAKAMRKAKRGVQ